MKMVPESMKIVNEELLTVSFITSSQLIQKLVTFLMASRHLKLCQLISLCSINATKKHIIFREPVSPPLIRQVKGLKDVREWSIMTTHSLNGSLEVQETFFLRSRKICITVNCSPIVSFLRSKLR